MQAPQTTEAGTNPTAGWCGPFYCNPQDRRVFVPKRWGWGWTCNFARPASWLIILGLVVAPAVLAAVMILLAR
jgi:uncharacterized membrane protein